MVHVGLELSRERSPRLTSFGAVHAPLAQVIMTLFSSHRLIFQ